MWESCLLKRSEHELWPRSFLSEFTNVFKCVTTAPFLKTSRVIRLVGTWCFSLEIKSLFACDTLTFLCTFWEICFSLNSFLVSFSLVTVVRPSQPGAVWTRSRVRRKKFDIRIYYLLNFPPIFRVKLFCRVKQNDHVFRACPISLINNLLHATLNAVIFITVVELS